MTKKLDVARTQELIHGANIKNPSAKRCSVTAKLRGGTGRNAWEKTFSRTVIERDRGNVDSEFRMDGDTISRDDYMTALEDLNIITKPRNFLVFQGQVTNIATMNPKQRTQWFEKVSRSSELKEDYDKLEKDLEGAQEDMRKEAKNKTDIATEEKEAKQEKKDSDEYQKKRDAVVSLLNFE